MVRSPDAEHIQEREHQELADQLGRAIDGELRVGNRAKPAKEDDAAHKGQGNLACAPQPRLTLTRRLRKNPDAKDNGYDGAERLQHVNEQPHPAPPPKYVAMAACASRFFARDMKSTVPSESVTSSPRTRRT